MSPFSSSLSFSLFPRQWADSYLTSAFFASSSQSNWLPSQFPIYLKTPALGFVPRCPDSILGTAGGSFSPPFVWNQPAVSTFWGLLVQFFCQPLDSTLGTTGCLDHNFPFNWKPSPRLCTQIPHWKLLMVESKFPIYLESLPRFHTGNCWWQLQLPICLESVCHPPLRSFSSIPFPSPVMGIIAGGYQLKSDCIQLKNGLGL